MTTAALTLFRCERRNVTLTPPGCGRLWDSARQDRPAPWEGRAACVACPIGALNAGQPGAAACPWRELLRPICAGCTRSSERIIGHRYCPSCYNRRLEAKRGRNRKGGVPRITALLHEARLTVADSSGARVANVGGVLDLSEAMLVVAKSADAAIVFGWPGVPNAA